MTQALAWKPTFPAFSPLLMCGAQQSIPPPLWSLLGKEKVLRNNCPTQKFLWFHSHAKNHHQTVNWNLPSFHMKISVHFLLGLKARPRIQHHVPVDKSQVWDTRHMCWFSACAPIWPKLHWLMEENFLKSAWLKKHVKKPDNNLLDSFVEIRHEFHKVAWSGKRHRFKEHNILVYVVPLISYMILHNKAWASVFLKQNWT